MMSPDDYRRASGYRRSSAAGITVPHASWAYDDNPLSEGVVFEDLKDPRLAAFLGAGRQSSAGVRVSEQTALRNSTFYRAVSLIAASIGMLPLGMKRTLPDGDTADATDHPLHRVLKLKPNGYQTPLEFKTQMQTAALLDGNAYARVARGLGRKIVGLVPMRRGSCQPQLADSGEVTFRFNPPSGGQQILQAQDVFHFRSMLTLDGLRGISLLDVAAQSIGVATAAEFAAGRLFKQGVMAGGALEAPNGLSDTAYARLKQDLEERYSGAVNAQLFMILEEGLKVSQFGGDPKNTQHLETRARQAEEISRFTGVPRPLLMFDETSWGTGIEQLGSFFVTYCLLAWFVAWEQAVERCLVDGELGVVGARFDDSVLLRGSLADQATFLSKALGNTNPWMAPNEARKTIGLNKIAGGEVLPAGGGSPAPDPPNPASTPPPAKKGAAV